MNLETIAAELIIFVLIVGTCLAVAIVALMEKALTARSAKQSAKRIEAIKARHAKEDANHAAFMADMRKQRKAHESKIAAMRNTLAKIGN